MTNWGGEGNRVVFRSDRGPECGRCRSDGASPPGVAERIIGGLVFAYGCLAAVATFCARLAQIFELWSEQCAVTAAQTRGRLVARPPALMARVMAAASAAAAGVAELLASLYGWRSFGGEVSRRAHLARLNTAANAKRARAAAQRPRACW